MINNENMEIIKKLPRRDRLEALAEEASELVQAALKVIRAEKLSKNPTPMADNEAKIALNEEFYDVLIAALALEFKIPSEEFLLNNFKVKRWAERIKGAEEDEPKVYLVEMVKSGIHIHTEVPLYHRLIVNIFATREEAKDWINKNIEWYQKYEPDFLDFEILRFDLNYFEE